MTEVKLRSRGQILGDIVRRIVVETDLSDVAEGSSLATLCEGIADSQAQIETTSLKILETTNLESLVGVALDKKAEGMKLPNGIGGIGRKPATQASGPITIGSAFAKISSKLYAGKPAPFAGSQTLYVENASDFPVSGSVYLGRGTIDRFEGPIPYSSVVDNGSFWTITLSSPLTKSHLHSDLVTLSQGGDRTVDAGTTVQVPSNSRSPAVLFTTVQSVVIPDGEAEVTVNVACTKFGEVGNALAGAIQAFASEPFSGATVTNSTSYRNGKSTENDEDLRQRIKTYPATLSRGTRAAIRAAIIGATDSDSGRTIQSAVVLEPVEPGDFARVYIDDGTGLEPTFGSQPYEELLYATSGQETRFRVAQFPITPAMAEGAEFGPYVVQNGQSISVQVDEVLETYYITGGDYENLNSATAYEIVRDLNSQSNIVGFRTLDGGTRVVMIDLSGTAETLQVRSGDLQKTLGFSVATLRPIFVYNNSELQSFRGHTATLTTRARNSWSLDLADLQDVRISVDGVIQTITIDNTDFLDWQTTIDTATIPQWATVLSRKIAGVKFTVSAQNIVWSTWQTFSEEGSLEILEERADGSPAGWIGDTKMWQTEESGGSLSDVGAEKDYKFNRFTGELNFITKPAAGSQIEVGSRTTRAYIRSEESSNGLFSLDPIPANVGNARLVLGFDGEYAIREVTTPSGAEFIPTVPDAVNASNIIRLTCNVQEVFGDAEVGDWMYLVYDDSVVPGWGSAVEGFYSVKAAGNNLYASDQTYISLAAEVDVLANASAEVKNDSAIVTITQTGHGLQTGDLITVSAGSAIGGISDLNLSQTDTAVTVLSSDKYTYVAGASATSDDTGNLDTVGSNIVEVTHASHGFDSGAYISVTTAADIGGILAANLSVTNAPLEYTSENTYRYRALQAATADATGNLDTLVYESDTWLEIEVSSPQLADWTPLIGVPQELSEHSVHLFRSTVMPQLVDFGNAVSTLDVDEAVDAINDSIVSGVAEKISPQQFVVRSSDYEEGTCAVLAVVGNATNIFSESTSSSTQAHVAYSSSGDVPSGFPVIKSVQTPTVSASGYVTRTYIEIDKTFVDILDESDNPAIECPSTVTAEYPSGFVSEYPVGFEHLWMTGRQAGLFGRVYNNQTTQPFSGIMRGDNAYSPVNTSDTFQTSPASLDRYANYGMRFQDIPFNNYDKFVVEMDLDPTDRTVAVPIAKIAKILDIDPITGSGKGQVISFRLKDPEDLDKSFFDNTSVYKAFDFADFKMLTKSVGLYREDVSDRALILRSVDYGAPNRLSFQTRFPTEPDLADFVVTHLNKYDDDTDNLRLIVTLPSQSLISGSTLGSGQYVITAALNGTLYDWRISAPTLNAGSEYVVGNVLNISGSTSIAESYEIIAQNYVNLSLASAAVTQGSNIITVTAASHGLETGDLANISASSAIGGIPASALSGSNVDVTRINASTFSYVADFTPVTIAPAAAAVTRNSAVISVSEVGHGLETGDTIWVTAAATIGNIPPANLAVSAAAVTKVDDDNFTYNSTFTLLHHDLPLTTVTQNDSNIKITKANHGYTTGDLVWISASSSIGNISAGDLTVSGVAVTVIDLSNFTYPSPATLKHFVSPVANVTNLSNVVTVTQAGHGMTTGDLIWVNTSTAIGGISAIDLSQQGVAITVIDPSTFSYVAAAAATSTVAGNLDTIDDTFDDTGNVDTVDNNYSDTGNLSTVNNTFNSAGLINSIVSGAVTVKAPGHGGMTSPTLYNAAANPIKSWELADKTLTELATAITDYYPDNPIATGEAIGSNLATNPVAHPTYVVYPASTAYAGSDMGGAFTHHDFDCKYSGSAGIWQYDSSVLSANGIKATVQTDDSIFPTTTDASGTSYSPIDEEVQIVPTNTKTCAEWFEFRAVSSLHLLAHIERIRSDSVLQLSSKEDGSEGAVKVTGVTANTIESTLDGNGSEDEESSKVNILSADARSIIAGSLVNLENGVAGEILRPYRDEPTGASITSANTTQVNTYFRTTTGLKYIRVNASTGRLIFYRNGMGPAQTEPLDSGNDITLTDLGNGLVQVTGAQGAGGVGTGQLSARTGDMMYIQPSSPFAADARCKSLPTSGISNGDAPEYLGYPVVHVIDEYNVIVIAPNITSFGTTAITSEYDLVFMAAVWNEKNIRTNHQEGALFDSVINGNKAYFLVKKLGNNLVSIWLQNSATEATDTMRLADMSVSTDDIAIFGNGFDPANQGSLRIVAHNGRNHMIVYNSSGGTDEIVNDSILLNGGTGDRNWRMGPLEDGIDRPIRILDSEGVRTGDLLRISTPSDTAQWFNDSFIGSWEISGIGYQAIDYGVDPLPHTESSGSADQSYICPYVDFEIPNAPLGVTDSGGSYVDVFLVGANATSIGFTEGTPFSCYRVVSGHGVNAQDAELSDVFLVPKLHTQKMSQTFGTQLTCLHKMDFEEQAFQGIDGYKIYAGLVQEAQRLIDGLPQNTVLYPGTKAAGAAVEVSTSLIKSIKLSLQVRPKDGITLNSITDLVKSTVAAYVNGLGPGSPVILSQIVRVVQSLPGVESVTVLDTTPSATDDRIVVSDIERVFILNVSDDITVG